MLIVYVSITVRSADMWFIIPSPGAAMFAPMVNPYDSKMTKDERRKTWDTWSTKRKLMHILARRFPSLLPFFYRQTFLSGKQGQPESWLSLSLGKKVCWYQCYVLSQSTNEKLGLLLQGNMGMACLFALPFLLLLYNVETFCLFQDIGKSDVRWYLVQQTITQGRSGTGF